jgi:two-component system invasion response regulator UvrY
MSTHSGGRRWHYCLRSKRVATGYELFRSHRPDVVVIDLSMRDVGLAGLSLIRRINAEDRRVPILVVSMHRDPKLVLQALEAGAVGYVLKRCCNRSSGKSNSGSAKR